MGAFAFLIWKMMSPSKDKSIVAKTPDFNMEEVMDGDDKSDETSENFNQQEEEKQEDIEPVKETVEPNNPTIDEPVEASLLESITIKGDKLIPRYIDGNKCAIIAAVLGDPKNVERMKKRIASLGYEVYHKPVGSVNRIGALVHCDEPSVLEAIAVLAEKIDKNAWLLADKE